MRGAADRLRGRRIVERAERADVGFVNSFGFETPNALNYGADTIIRRAGSNHLSARGDLSIPSG